MIETAQNLDLVLRLLSTDCIFQKYLFYGIVFIVLYVSYNINLTLGSLSNDISFAKVIILHFRTVKWNCV